MLTFLIVLPQVEQVYRGDNDEWDDLKCFTKNFLVLKVILQFSTVHTITFSFFLRIFFFLEQFPACDLAFLSNAMFTWLKLHFSSSPYKILNKDIPDVNLIKTVTVRAFAAYVPPNYLNTIHTETRSPRSCFEYNRFSYDAFKSIKLFWQGGKLP